MGGAIIANDGCRLKILAAFTVMGARSFGEFKRSNREGRMMSPAETALTVAFVKAIAIVGSALTAVFFLALLGAKRL